MKRHQIAHVPVILSLPVSVTLSPIPLLREYIKRGNVLKLTQDVGGRQHKIPLEDDLTDGKRIFSIVIL